jgi:hypothetical protein
MTNHSQAMNGAARKLADQPDSGTAEGRVA